MSSFVVYQDTQTGTTPASDSASSTDLSNESSQPTTAITTTSATSTEKENINPATGELPPAGGAKNRKRKTGVLTTKVSAVTGEKQKERKERKPEAKKRKAASVATKGLSSGNKANRTSGSSRKGNMSNRSSNTNVTLPKVEEETDKDTASQREAERLAQAEIDSKVYELTVKPLADVTKAFDQGSPSRAKQRLCTVKGDSSGTESFDYPSLSLSDVTLPSKIRPPVIALATPPKETKSFSTPERKKIYAAFTFSSPSSTSDRIFRSRVLTEAHARVKPASS